MRFFLFISLGFTLAFTLACSTGHHKKANKNSFTYMDFEQRAPASLSPKIDFNGELNELHLSTQADYHFTMAEAYSLEGQIDRAIESYRLTLVYDQNAFGVRVKLAAEFLKKGLVSEAIEQAKIALQQEPSLVSAHFLLAGIYTSLKMYSKAKEKYKKILELQPDNEESALYVGAILVELKDYENALKYFNKIATKEDSNVRYLGYYYKGKVYEMQLNNKKAQRAYELSLADNPRFIDSVVSLGDIYKISSRQKTKRFYESFLEKYGSNLRLSEMLASLYIEDEEYEDALKHLYIVERGPENLENKLRIAMILIEQKSYKEAVTRLQAILRQVPESDRIRFYLAAVYEELNEYKKAIDVYKGIPLASSYFIDASIHGIYLMKSLNRLDEALKWNEEVLKKRPDAIQFYTLYASLLDEKKDYEAAVSFLKKAEKSFPEEEQIQYFLGSFFDKVGDKEECIARMRRVLTINPNHSQAMNYIAYTYAEMGKNLEEAIDLALRANELKPNDPYFLDTLGWIHFQKGDYKKAIKYLEAAYKLLPTESIIAHHLGDAYYHYQLPLKARLYYAKALESENDNEERSKIRQKLVSVDNALSNSAAVSGSQPAARKPASKD